MEHLLGFHISFPITDPTWIFFLVLSIILFAPVILSRLNIPHIIGMIIAGILIGEHGFNILARDSSFRLFGNVGLYYIMFLAGLEMDMANFKSIRGKAIVFGILGFIVPMVLGYAANAWVLGYAVVPSLLIASMYASHTLVSYPIVLRYGVSRQRSVSITVGATAITDCLTLIVLAILGGQYKEGGGDSLSWLWLILRVAILGWLIVFTFPRIGRWFFRKYNNGVVQFIFVLAMVFLAAGLMKLVGMEGILGAFLAGLVLNRLIPHVSPLMHNLEFVGNALFIPYFLIGVGMLIDLRVFFGQWGMLEVVGVMLAMAFVTKWIAAWLTQKFCRMASVERSMMFGLSMSRAAATLAVVLVGYAIILPDGSHLLGDEILNGAIAMILVTCIVGSFATERASRRMALEEAVPGGEPKDSERERILISIANPETVDHLMGLSLLIRDPKLTDEMVALSVIEENATSSGKEHHDRMQLQHAARIASAADVELKQVCRYSLNVASGIIHTQKEQDATEVIVGLHRKSSIMDSYFGGLTETLLREIHREIMIVKLLMPLNTLRRIVVAIPPKAEYEAGFSKWVQHVGRMSSMLGCRIHFYGTSATLRVLDSLIRNKSVRENARLCELESWDDLLLLTAQVNYDHLLVVVSARRGSISYNTAFERLPSQLTHYFANNSLLLIYPDQFGDIAALPAFADPMSNAANSKLSTALSHLRKLASRLFGK